ncbi:MAG TPA: chaperone protein [Methanosarcina sp.]|jgi:hypothetical protein|nr:chaperone protein [Methanosarcina sp.]
MSEDAILRLQQTGLFKKLLEKENEEIEKTSLVDHEISQNIISVVRKAAPLLERIPENMPEFTLHNANHSVHVIENIEKIIPCETLKQLNSIEISILIYAAYLHDIGMIASSDDRKQIVKTSEFKKHLTSNEELYEKFEEAKNNSDYEVALNMENKAFTDFLRKNHVQHAHKIIEEYKLDSEISWKDIPYYNWVMAVCDSHELPVKDLYNTKSWPNDTFIRDKPVNVQYLAVIFRLADKLDIDPERTPKHLFYYLNPKDEISIKEWNKHLSITGFPITPEKIKIVADCKHPEQERTLRKFIKEIDKEIEDSYQLVSSYRDNLEEKYTLKLSEPVYAEIHSIDYEYCDFHFELDYRRVLDLLMGEGLYGDPIVALRELLQNSVDAVRYRESLEKREGNGYNPSIEVSLIKDELIVEDNGIGMDEKIFENYFMKVGRSYYQSLDFRQKNVNVDPISEFGIGILSVFMVANNFTVESRRKTFEDELNPSKPIYFEIPTAYDYFIKKQSKRSKYGTKITLYLKPNHPFSAETLMEKISEIAPFIEYSIKVHTIERTQTYRPLLPGEIPSTGKKTKKYFEILFGENDNLEGIEGRINVVSGSYYSNDNCRIIAQRGFSIPSEGLFPDWISDNLDVSINLSGQEKLTLSPSRQIVVKDKKHSRIANLINLKYIEELDKHLKTYKNSNSVEKYLKYVDEILKLKILNPGRNKYSINPGPINQQIKKIFLENVPFPFLSANGKKTYQFVHDLETLPFIGITGVNDWPDKISDKRIFEEFKNEATIECPLLLLDGDEDLVKKDFFEGILGNPKHILITSIPGVVIEIISNDSEEKGVFSIQGMFLTYEMVNNGNNGTPFFVHIPYAFDTEEVIFNARHPLIFNLLEGRKPKNEICLKALRVLSTSLSSIFNQLINILPPNVYSDSRICYSKNINYMLIGILEYYPEIINKFDNIVQEFWREAQKLGAVSSEEKCRKFTAEDLPWFWNYKKSYEK